MLDLMYTLLSHSRQEEIWFADVSPLAHVVLLSSYAALYTALIVQH